LVSLLALLVWQNAGLDDNGCAASTNESVYEDFDDFDIPDETPRRDPLGCYNRFMFRVNDRVYFWVLKPVAKAYGRILPEQVRLSIQRCAKNLTFPSRFVSSGLQGKFKGAGSEVARFGINSTLGLLGLFDPADSLFDLEPSDEDFGQTLGRYGVGEGCPLVLPLLGQTNLRDAIGMVPDYFLHPVSHLDHAETAGGIRCFEKANYSSLHIGEYEALKEDALDPYTLIRDAYRKKREASIKE